VRVFERVAGQNEEGEGYMSTWTHERKETHKTTVTQVGMNLFTFSESFRRIRKKDKGCKFCRKPFVNDQYLHLAFTNKGNKLLCDDCANKAIENGVPFIDKKADNSDEN
jgi:hypothetical protein